MRELNVLPIVARKVSLFSSPWLRFGSKPDQEKERNTDFKTEVRQQTPFILLFDALLSRFIFGQFSGCVVE